MRKTRRVELFRNQTTLKPKLASSSESRFQFKITFTEVCQETMGMHEIKHGNKI
jgi:hypothetical protein